MNDTAPFPWHGRVVESSIANGIVVMARLEPRRTWSVVAGRYRPFVARVGRRLRFGDRVVWESVVYVGAPYFQEVAALIVPGLEVDLVLGRELFGGPRPHPGMNRPDFFRVTPGVVCGAGQIAGDVQSDCVDQKIAGNLIHNAAFVGTNVVDLAVRR